MCWLFSIATIVVLLTPDNLANLAWLNSLFSRNSLSVAILPTMYHILLNYAILNNMRQIWVDVKTNPRIGPAYSSAPTSKKHPAPNTC